jgi:hypothetical protein
MTKMLLLLQLVVIVKSMMPTGEGDAFATVKVGVGVRLESQQHDRCSVLLTLLAKMLLV